MADESGSRKGRPGHRLEQASPAPDDGAPRVLGSAVLRREADLGRRSFFRGAAAAGAGVAASLLACGGGSDGHESQYARTCDRKVSLSHQGAVTAVAWAPDGQKLATAGADGAVKIWDAGTGALLSTLTGHAGQVNSVAFSPDGARLASGGADSTARLWGVSDGAPLRVYGGHAGGVLGVAFFPDGARVASASADGSVQLWSAATGAAALTYLGHGSGAQVTCLAVSPDGARVASGGTDAAVRVWSAADGQTSLVYGGHAQLPTPYSGGGQPKGIASVAFFPGGTKVISGGSYEQVFAGGPYAQIWDPATGACLLSIDPNVASYGSAAFFVAVSPDGALVALGGQDGIFQVLAATDGAVRFRSRGQGGVRSVSFSPAGARVASAGDDQCALVWDASTGAGVVAMRDRALDTTSSDSGRTACNTGATGSLACSCDEVCACDQVCSCNSVCTCDSEGGAYYYPN